MATSKKFLLLGFLLLVVLAALATLITLLLLKNPESEEQDDADNESYDGPTYGYTCENSLCNRVEITHSNVNITQALDVCRLTCGEDIGTLWPKPSGSVQFSKRVTAINPNKITVLTSNFKSEQIYWQAAWQRFREMQFRKLPNDDDDDDGVKLSAGQSVLVAIIAESDEMTFNYDTFEGYKLMIFEGASGEVHVYISARNFYGTRHALETLSQLIVFDEHENALVILAQAEISDEPKFKHRGFSMDTSRTFFPVDVLKRTINGLAMVKLNTFHWHITDAQSFPFEVKSRPELAKYGAYSPDKVYTASDVRDVVEYARARGVRVIPELDAPAHMGEGWKESGLTKCYKDPELRAQWRGQIDPTNDEVYEILADVYREMVDAFEPTFFHMGGDEVNITCWNTSATITEWMTARGMDRTVDGFMQLWIHFQRNALEKLDSVSDRELPLILWTSSLTKEPYLSQIVDKDRYVIQLWTYSNDASIKPILEAGYKVIISNSDVLYLDCGLGWWVRDGLNWCQPHKNWQMIYNNRMETIAGSYIDQVLGAESAVWSESIDESTIDAVIWPRASAFAERLWTNPQTPWAEAEARLLMNRKRLVEEGGLAAEPLQLEWCVQNEAACPS